MRLRQELMARGVADEYIEQALAESECNWQALAEQVRRKRFGGQMPKDFKEKAKQLRFLQYRGFSNGEDF
jgi:regulatory protein